MIKRIIDFVSEVEVTPINHYYHQNPKRAMDVVARHRRLQTVV